MSVMKLFATIFLLSLFVLSSCGNDEGVSVFDEDDLSSSVIVQSSSTKATSSKSSSSRKGKSSSSAKSSSSVKYSSSNKVKTSSSSKVNSSSSEKKALSSSGYGCKNGGTDTCEYGTLTDNRDGKIYKTVIIGTQKWMAENLNYESANSYCYKDNADNCVKYGRLYSWSEAMDSAGVFSANGKGCGFDEVCVKKYPLRGICPSGWHLPTEEEFNELLSFVKRPEDLKSTSGWFKDVNGSDAYGFSAFPFGSGYISDDGSMEYGTDGLSALFWSSTESIYESEEASALYLGYYDFSICEKECGNDCDMDVCYRFHLGTENVGKKSVFSVRCVQDEVGDLVWTDTSVYNSQYWYWFESKESFLNPNIAYDSIVDKRDNKVYKTVKIGDQVWMAENLNYFDSSLTENSSCYKQNVSRCDVAGRLYTWSAAIDSANTFKNINCDQDGDCTLAYPVRGICPSGWHLPAREEFETLLTTVGDSSIVGKKLLSSCGRPEKCIGTDDYGFSAFPAGYRWGNVGYDLVGVNAFFWSSTGEFNGSKAYYMLLTNKNGFKGVEISRNPVFFSFSVRCLKD